MHQALEDRPALVPHSICRKSAVNNYLTFERGRFSRLLRLPVDLDSASFVPATGKRPNIFPQFGKANRPAVNKTPKPYNPTIAKPSDMADPLSITVSVLAVVTAAIQSTKSLSATVKRYKDRDKTLNRLQYEVEDLTTVLSSLKGAADSDESISTLLEGPIDRCSQVCREFEDAMEKFSGKTKTGLRDWTKLEFMRGNINDFMDTLASYKSTIMVGLGTITMSVAYLIYLELRLTILEASLQTQSRSPGRLQ